MSNGSILGVRRTPSKAAASGLWTPNEVLAARLDNTWPGPLSTHVGSFTKSTATGNQDITIPVDLTEAPAGSWAVMFWLSGSAVASGTWDPDIYTSLGFAANGGGTVSQYVTSCRSSDASATSDTSRRQATGVIALPDDAGTIALWAAEMGATPFPTATTMRINWTTNNVSSMVVNYMIITGLSNAKVVDWVSPAISEDLVVTNVGFSPDLVLHGSVVLSNMNTSAVNAWLGFGAMNKHGQQWANGWVSQDGQDVSETARYQQTDACIAIPAPGNTKQMEAQYKSMNSDGFTMYFSQASNGARGIALCMQGVSSKLGAIQKSDAAAPATQVVNSRQNFTPRGSLFAGITANPIGAPIAGGYWTMGASDFTNHRAVTLQDIDALATTSAVSLRLNDSTVVVGYGNTPTVFSKGYPSAVDEDSLTLTWPTNDSGLQEFLYLLLGDAGNDTFPVHIRTSTSAQATAHSNQKLGVTLSAGRMVMVNNQSSAANGRFQYSDDGLTWTVYAADINGWTNGSIDSYVDSGGTERLVAVWKQSGTGGGRVDTGIYIMVGSFNADRTTLTWGSSVRIGVSGLSNYLDVVAHAEGTGGMAHLVFSYTEATTNNNAYYHPVTIDSAGVPTIGAQFEFGPAYGSPTFGYGNGNHTFPSIDIDPATKRLFVAWSAGTTGAGKGIRFRTASYSAGAWTWDTEREVDTTQYVYDTYNSSIQCRWDGTAVYICAGGNQTDAGTWRTRVFESTDFFATAPTTRLSDALSGTSVWYPSLVIDPVTRDIHLVGTYWITGGPWYGLKYRKWTRATTTWSAWLDADVVVSGGAGTTTHSFPYTWYANGKINWVYTAGNNSPYAVKYDRILT